MRSPKRIISANGGPRSLQMVPEPDTRRCVSPHSSLKGVDTKLCANKKDAGPKGGGEFGEGPTSIGGRNEWEQGHGKHSNYVLAFSLFSKGGRHEAVCQ